MARICAPGKKIAGRYVIRGFVGEGGMQEVYRAADELLVRDVALKTPKNPSAKKRFKRSAVVSAKINHANVAKTLDYIEDDGRDYLIEEFIDGYDLSRFLREIAPVLDPSFAATVFHHLVKGLAASHHAGVMHRDLKPSNIMVAGGANAIEFKITDFGVAKMAEEEIAEAVEGGDSSILASVTAIGALPYMAPELIQNKGEAGLPADVWSLGALLFELISGTKPFGIGLPAIVKIAAGVVPNLPALAGMPNPQFETQRSVLRDIAANCLRSDPAKRPTADELVKVCGELCYLDSDREFGVVSSVRNSNWGFLTSDAAQSVFFHRESVFNAGMLPAGTRVWFAKHAGGGSDRAFPVLKLP